MKQPTKRSAVLIGAGEGNRTLVLSLGSFRSTIELHPQSMFYFIPNNGICQADFLKELYHFSIHFL